MCLLHLAAILATYQSRFSNFQVAVKTKTQKTGLAASFIMMEFIDSTKSAAGKISHCDDY